MDAARTTRQLEETIDEFERHKIQDIKVSVFFRFDFLHLISCLLCLFKTAQCKVSGSVESEARRPVAPLVASTAAAG